MNANVFLAMILFMDTRHIFPQLENKTADRGEAERCNFDDKKRCAYTDVAKKNVPDKPHLPPTLLFVCFSCEFSCYISFSFSLLFVVVVVIIIAI